MMLQHALTISAYLFCIGIYGLITSRSMVRALMCLELMLNGVNLNFVAFSAYLDEGFIQGQLFVLFIIAIAAAEAAIGLAIVLNIYRNRNSIRLDQFNILKW
jgi:NADH:ubiquinone oxidoreductase subunit K